MVDELLAGARSEDEIVGTGGLLSQLTKRRVERAMEVELTDHFGFELHLEPPGGTGNARNGTAEDVDPRARRVAIDAPRDRTTALIRRSSASASGGSRGSRGRYSRSTLRGREVLDAGRQRSKQRRVQDILIACVNGLKGFPEAIEAVFPATTVQICIVHLIRHSLRCVPRRQYDQVAKDLRPIYTAIDADAALNALEAFEEKWRQQLPVIGQAWRSA